jgi:hypothetical protein
MPWMVQVPGSEIPPMNGVRKAPDVAEIVSRYKEILGLAGSALTGTVGIAKTISEIRPLGRSPVLHCPR